MKTWKDRVTGDYSHIRGVCHGPRFGQSREEMERYLDYARQLNLNSTRFWLSQEQWEKDREGYEELILGFVRACRQREISVMPILWNGNFIQDYQPVTEDGWRKKREYAAAMVGLLKKEPGLLMWDVCNEPFCNDYMNQATVEEYPARRALLSEDLRKMCLLLRELDDDTPITVGHESAGHLDSTADLVDVISFHDYLPTRPRIRAAYEQSFAMAEGKPVLNTETGCIGRANPYDVELEMCREFQCGFYLFNLVIDGFWGQIHGLVYPDGTARDPGIIAALFGFFRNRSETRILPDGNREQHAYRAVRAVEKALKTAPSTLFMSEKSSTDEILDAAEYCINILEACEQVAMFDAPSARLMALRNQPPEQRNEQQIRRFAYEMAKLVKETYMIL